MGGEAAYYSLVPIGGRREGRRTRGFRDTTQAVRVLMVGAGVIGTVYGANLAGAGHRHRRIGNAPGTAALRALLQPAP